MESKHPLVFPTAADFDNAIADYKEMFGKEPPGVGREEARYFVTVLALDCKEEATQAFLDKCVADDKPVKKAV